jgi:putative methionine-R-sulfoxide reductase with GAF domain
MEDLTDQFEPSSPQLEGSYTDLKQRVAERTKELATLNAIATVVSRSLDLQDILNDALDKTLQVMGLQMGGVYLLDRAAGVLNIASCRGLRPEFVQRIGKLRLGQSFSGRVAQSIVVSDISSDHRLTRMVVRAEGLRSFASVPLISKRKVLGTLFAATHDYREFTGQDVQLLTSIGHQIGVAIENAHLYEVKQKRAEQFRLISGVGRDIVSILDVDEPLGELARRVSDILGYYLVGVGLVEGDEVVVRTGAGPYWGTYRHEPPCLKVGTEGVVGWVASSGKLLLAPDVTPEPRYYHVPGISSPV